MEETPPTPGRAGVGSVSGQRSAAYLAWPILYRRASGVAVSGPNQRL